MTYYGFKALLLTSGKGGIEDIALFASHVGERDALVDMDWPGIHGMLLGNKGFIRLIHKADLADHGIDLHTPLRRNMNGSRPRPFIRRAV